MKSAILYLFILLLCYSSKAQNYFFDSSTKGFGFEIYNSSYDDSKLLNYQLSYTVMNRLSAGPKIITDGFKGSNNILNYGFFVDYLIIKQDSCQCEQKLNFGVSSAFLLNDHKNNYEGNIFSLKAYAGSKMIINNSINLFPYTSLTYSRFYEESDDYDYIGNQFNFSFEMSLQIKEYVILNAGISFGEYNSGVFGVMFIVPVK